MLSLPHLGSLYQLKLFYKSDGTFSSHLPVSSVSVCTLIISLAANGAEVALGDIRTAPSGSGVNHVRAGGGTYPLCKTTTPRN